MGDTRLIQGRYRLLDLIGRGGMGEVWRARDESLGRHVAVKCLKPLNTQADPAFTRVLRERFRREARMAAALQHRGVTVVHDFGETDGVLYLVMELLEGRNLSQLLEDNKHHPLPLDDIVEIADQTAAALAYTHQQSIVHRDLKPANIMRLTDGTVKICDFGIARLGHDIGFTSRLTGTGIAMGTPHYMSPEQIGGDQVDHRSDLYSFGCVLYEIATGVPPFDLDDAWAVLIGHRDTPPEPPRSHRAELPEYVERIILDLLAKQPGERPRDARELEHRLHEGRTASGYVPMAVSRPAAPSAHLAAPLIPSREPRLPSWTRGMTTGHKAAGRGPRTTPPDASAGLAGDWTARPAPDHPDTLTGRYERGLLLSRTGRPADALREYTHVARVRERTLGPDHPDTLAARHEMAYVLGKLGRHFDAHQAYAAVLAARERVLGPDHPDTLRCRHNLAFNLSRLGRLEDSYEMASDVAAARTRVLGPNHPDTLVTGYEVAYLLGQLGRWPEALRRYREVAEARAQALGPDHPDTLAARYEAGISLGRLGRPADALTLYRTLVEDRTRVLGPAHPETLRARHGLGVNLGRLGRWEEALAESREVCALRERVLGPDHPDTLVSRREVAVGLGWLGRWADALTEYRRVAEARERVLGAGHADALASRNDEAHCLEQLGRGAEAVELYRRVAVLRQQRAASGH